MVAEWRELALRKLTYDLLRIYNLLQMLCAVKTNNNALPFYDKHTECLILRAHGDIIFHVLFVGND